MGGIGWLTRAIASGENRTVPTPSNPSDDSGPASTGPRPTPQLTVSGLTEALKQRFAQWGRVAVEGEVVGLKRAGSGHLYFSLKEGGAVIACALWRSRVERALGKSGGQLEEGDQVQCTGTLDIYAPRGTYSLMVETVAQRGLGQRLVELEKLKGRLKERGWFDRARPLPVLPKIVGVVTSRDADGFEDFLRTRSLRWPRYPLRFVHTRVQGPGAAEEIAAAVTQLDASGVDLICLVRGGGSIEDLWAFNEEVVAEAIFGAQVPVVTGIGHEPDLTLADLVADQRAHTPTDAALRTIPDRQSCFDSVETLEAHLERAMDQGMEQRSAALSRLSRARVLLSSDWILKDRVGLLGSHERRMGLSLRSRLQLGGARLQQAASALSAQAPSARIVQLDHRLQMLSEKLTRQVNTPMEKCSRALDLAQRTLFAVSPLAVLGRGYSITRRADGGAVLGSVDDIAPGQSVETVLAQGRILSTVNSLIDGECDPATHP